MPQIIHLNDSQLHACWQKELANVVTDTRQLLQMLNIDIGDQEKHFSARQLFPLRVPRPFIKRMEKGNINDPLLKQVMVQDLEFEQIQGYSTDPLEEHDTVAEGLLHKYRNRVLMIVKAGCAVNCRYCFRRHFPYEDNSPNKRRWQKALDYISAHPEIQEVIFSGGDPLMASDDHLTWLVKQLEEINHIKRLRIHSRLPVVIPQRITPALVELLANSRLKAVMVFHINHPNEIDQTFTEAIEPLREAFIPLFNQSVLLKDVNDDAAVLCQLSEDLFDIGIQPYYLHAFDPVQGAAHFDVNDELARAIAREMMANLPGFLMPKLVREIAGEPNKTMIPITTED
ncbi:EF-P beta-lysylation protein EpmB [Thalassotalea sp. PS06]|uniref:EF-P beta-lysylation protein EpmB n=1 Tax=Thalassotalea sp. PS06 TaxID=2594005 RepID=UPI0011655882|nr:EF-P beta-lysylation protein EpmB [Thalassotalea sp. PS06]QDP02447.1 EF-P beta-lysylation protein EpmB [Thalassotalea sp. PS06]